MRYSKKGYDCLHEGMNCPNVIGGGVCQYGDDCGHYECPDCGLYWDVSEGGGSLMDDYQSYNADEFDQEHSDRIEENRLNELRIQYEGDGKPASTNQ
jgi:hypothetical protein